MFLYPLSFSFWESVQVPSLQWKVTPNISCWFLGDFCFSSRQLLLCAFFTAAACSKWLLLAPASAAHLSGSLGSILDTIPLSGQIPLTYAYCGLHTIATIALLFKVICEFLKSSLPQELSHDLAWSLAVNPVARVPHPLTSYSCCP